MEKITIKKYQLKELQEFINSIDYKRLKTKPISHARVASYWNNPRAKQDDYVIYIAYIKEEIVGFRTVLSDCIYNNNKIWRFGWLSGNWVDYNHRRKGISSSLFKQVYSDWNGMLAYTNAAPSSNHLFHCSGKFTNKKPQQGVRIYLKPIIYKILKHRSGIIKRTQLLVKSLEIIISILTMPYLWIITNIWKRNLKKISISKQLTPEIETFINQNPKSYFNRKSTDYQWISKYQWVKKNSEFINYPFSYQYKRLNVAYLTTQNSKGKIDGLSIVKNYNGHASVPYYFSENKDTTLFKAILGWIHSNKVDYASFYKQEMLDSLKTIHFVALFRKNIVRYTDISKILSEKAKLNLNEIHQQDGDGDSIFT